MRSTLLPLLSSLLLTLPSLASDGVLEIHQTCATQTGCFSGDMPGFPVTITQEGSYRLTSNLTVATQVDAIAVQASWVTIDLAGFAIAGSGSCTGSGSTLSCDSGNGSGIVLSGGSRGLRVRQGTIRNMHRHGIFASSGDGGHFADLILRHNGFLGVAAGRQTTVTECKLDRNGSGGLQVSAGSVVERSAAVGNGDYGLEVIDGIVTNSTSIGNAGNGIQSIAGGSVSGSFVRNNAGRGFELAASARYGHGNSSATNVLPDRCGGGICTSVRRHFITQDLVPATDALAACPEGFHMASLPELSAALGSLVYDPVLGKTSDDSGFGPPTRSTSDNSGPRAWIRSGGSANLTVNCLGWTDDSLQGRGAVGFFPDPKDARSAWVAGAPGRGWASGCEETVAGFFECRDRPLAPLAFFQESCSASRSVWCIEDAR